MGKNQQFKVKNVYKRSMKCDWMILFEYSEKWANVKNFVK